MKKSKQKDYEHEKKGKTDSGKQKKQQVPDSEDEPEKIEAEIFKLEDIESTRKSVDSEIKSSSLKEVKGTSPRLDVGSVEGEKLTKRCSQEAQIIMKSPERNLFTDINTRAFALSDVPLMREKERNLKNVKINKTIDETETLIGALKDLRSEREIIDEVRKVELKDGTTRKDMEFEVKEEMDPFFNWSFGSPYGDRFPKLIINLDKEDLPNLKVLQILLRDTYKEMEGGEPGAYPVEFVANEPRFPEIQGNIVTLDLTDGWEPETGGSKPSIKRSGQDIVPRLKDMAENMYTGEMGFLIVNIPYKWKKSWRLSNFVDNLVSYLSAGRSEDRLPPVLSVETRHEKKSKKRFWKLLCQYFGLRAKAVGSRDVPRVEEIYKSSLRRIDWKRVAIVERDKNGDESDEHYFIKASIVEGFAYHCYQEYKKDDPDISYNQFFKKHILEKSWIETEKEFSGRKADIKFSTDNENLQIDSSKVLRSFFTPELDSSIDEVFIEVETGRSEGAFNFRKLREKVNNYGDKRKLWIVIPPRLLFRGKKRALMIKDLVEKSSDDKKSANLAIPLLNKVGVTQLRKVNKSFLESIYGDEEQ